MKVIDLHCDTLSELYYARKCGVPMQFAESPLHIDLKKLQQGDYLLQCFAMFINLGESQDPLVAALEQADIFRQIMEKYADAIGQVKTWEDLQENRKKGRISAMLTVEEGACCKGNLSVLHVLYSLGVRIMTLTWNYENDLAWPNVVPGDGMKLFPCAADEEHGLKDKGYAFIEEMERLGILIDVSHLSDGGFWDVAEHTSGPFIASHSNARAMCGHVRNLTDEMIRTIADRGGVIGLNFCKTFLDPAHKSGYVLDFLVRHAAYLREKGGIDCISLGSDLDGIKGVLDMKDASCMPLLEKKLRENGFTEQETEKIFYGNALRLFKDVLPLH